MKRAENAIFARAINAIRPIEIKKICPERQKLYSNDSITELEISPTISSTHPEKSSDDSLQITLLNTTEQERSVEIKTGTRQQKNKTPVRSIKERLGKKLNEDVTSRSKTPQRKSITDTRIERVKSRSKERKSREQDRRRDNRDRKHRSPRRPSPNDDSQGSVSRRNENQKSSDRNNREKDRRRNSSENRENKYHKKSNRDEYKPQTEKTPRDTDRERELQNARVRARLREEERTKEKIGKRQSQLSLSIQIVIPKIWLINYYHYCVYVIRPTRKYCRKCIFIVPWKAARIKL